MKKAFTLIELLVVVLIIGVLAAIALPQYQKSVEKSRASEGVINLRTLVNAMELYKLANGEASKSLDVLDLHISGERLDARRVKTTDFTYDIRNFQVNYEVVATRNGSGSDIMKYYFYHSYFGTMGCVAMKPEAKVICSALCGHNTFTPHSPPTYSICMMN